MKFIYLFGSLLFLKIVNALKPFFIRMCVFSEKACGLIKSFSSSILSIKNSQLLLTNFESKTKPNLQTIISTDCDLDNQNCKKNIIIPGYMEHDYKKVIKH
jgi:hypothetical protein